MTKQFFRRIITIYWLVFLAIIVVVSTSLNSLPPELQGYVDAPVTTSNAASEAILSLVSGVFLVCCIVASIGLYMFRNWARTLGSIIAVTSLILLPVLGPSVMTGFESALSALNNMLYGAILALSYFSQISESFEGKKTSANLV